MKLFTFIFLILSVSCSTHFKNRAPASVVVFSNLKNDYSDILIPDAFGQQIVFLDRLKNREKLENHIARNVDRKKDKMVFVGSNTASDIKFFKSLIKKYNLTNYEIYLKDLSTEYSYFSEHLRYKTSKEFVYFGSKEELADKLGVDRDFIRNEAIDIKIDKKDFKLQVKNLSKRLLKEACPYFIDPDHKKICIQEVKNTATDLLLERPNDQTSDIVKALREDRSKLIFSPYTFDKDISRYFPGELDINYQSQAGLRNQSDHEHLIEVTKSKKLIELEEKLDAIKKEIVELENHDELLDKLESSLSMRAYQNELRKLARKWSHLNKKLNNLLNVYNGVRLEIIAKQAVSFQYEVYRKLERAPHPLYLNLNKTYTDSKRALAELIRADKKEPYMREIMALTEDFIARAKSYNEVVDGSFVMEELKKRLKILPDTIKKILKKAVRVPFVKLNRRGRSHFAEKGSDINVKGKNNIPKVRSLNEINVFIPLGVNGEQLNEAYEEKLFQRYTQVIFDPYEKSAKKNALGDIVVSFKNNNNLSKLILDYKNDNFIIYPGRQPFRLKGDSSRLLYTLQTLQEAGIEINLIPVEFSEAFKVKDAMDVKIGKPLPKKMVNLLLQEHPTQINDFLMSSWLRSLGKTSSYELDKIESLIGKLGKSLFKRYGKSCPARTQKFLESLSRKPKQ